MLGKIFTLHSIIRSFDQRTDVKVFSVASWVSSSYSKKASWNFIEFSCKASTNNTNQNKTIFYLFFCIYSWQVNCDLIHFHKKNLFSDDFPIELQKKFDVTWLLIVNWSYDKEIAKCECAWKDFFRFCSVSKRIFIILYFTIKLIFRSKVKKTKTEKRLCGTIKWNVWQWKF